MYFEEKKAGFGKAIKSSVGSGIFVKKAKRVGVICFGARLQSIKHLQFTVMSCTYTFPF